MARSVPLLLAATTLWLALGPQPFAIAGGSWTSRARTPGAVTASMPSPPPTAPPIPVVTATPALKPLAGVSLAFVLQTTAVTAAETERVRQMLFSWLATDVAQHWPIPAYTYTFYLQEKQQAGHDIAYHALLGGQPVAYVAVGQIVASGGSWTWWASHELVEMVSDPTTTAMVTHSGTQYLREAVDPVAANFYLYRGYQVADYVYPSYFAGGSGPFDHWGYAPSPLAPACGGYQWTLTSGSWVAVPGSC